jgi:hypothetical protein
MRRFSRLSGPVAAWTGLDRLHDTTTTSGNQLFAVQSSLEADSEKTKTGLGPVASKIVKKLDWTGLSNTNYTPFASQVALSFPQCQTVWVTTLDLTNFEVDD